MFEWMTPSGFRKFLKLPADGTERVARKALRLTGPNAERFQGWRIPSAFAESLAQRKRANPAGTIEVWVHATMELYPDLLPALIDEHARRVAECIKLSNGVVVRARDAAALIGRNESAFYRWGLIQMCGPMACVDLKALAQRCCWLVPAVGGPPERIVLGEVPVLATALSAIG